MRALLVLSLNQARKALMSDCTAQKKMSYWFSGTGKLGSSLIHWACETRMRTAVTPLLRQWAVFLYMDSGLLLPERTSVGVSQPSAKCPMDMCPWQSILRLFICFSLLEKELLHYVISRVQVLTPCAYLTCPAQVYQKQILRSVHTEVCYCVCTANARQSL